MKPFTDLPQIFIEELDRAMGKSFFQAKLGFQATLFYTWNH